MEALEPEEYLAEFQEYKRRAETEEFDVEFNIPFLSIVLAAMYRTAASKLRRFISQQQLDTLSGDVCHCCEPRSNCVCDKARHFILKCWFRFASTGEMWLVARLLSAYTRNVVLDNLESRGWARAL